MLQDRFYVGGTTRNIAIRLVLQQCCKTSCKLFVAPFTVPLVFGHWPRVNVTSQLYFEIEVNIH